jgi:hypothetical protein
LNDLINGGVCEFITGHRAVEKFQGVGGAYVDSAMAMTEGADTGLAQGGVLRASSFLRRRGVSLFRLCA